MRENVTQNDDDDGCTLNSLVEIIYAVDLIGSINSERDTIQGFAADNTGEALGVVRLSCCSQNSV